MTRKEFFGLIGALAGAFLCSPLELFPGRRKPAPMPGPKALKPGEWAVLQNVRRFPLSRPVSFHWDKKTDTWTRVSE